MVVHQVVGAVDFRLATLHQQVSYGLILNGRHFPDRKRFCELNGLQPAAKPAFVGGVSGRLIAVAVV